jgi:hypothetical protein
MKLPPLRSKKRKRLDVRVLRQNDISILILDERWNMLFKNTPKSSSIERLENKLKELLKEESRLIEEQNDLAHLKKKHMAVILSLTEEVFDKDNKEAMKEMQTSQGEIKRISERNKIIDSMLDNMPKRIKNANLELLEEAVNLVYYKFRMGIRRREELNKLIAEQERIIEEARAKMKGYIDEKEALASDNTDIYSYFHDLLGAEVLEKLDRKFFKKFFKKKRD